MEILVGTQKGLFRIPEKGEPDFGGRSVTHLVRNSEGIWALVDRSEVCLLRRQSAWQKLGEIPARANCLLPLGSSNVLVGTARANLYRISDGAADRVESFDHVPGRQSWYTPWGGPPDIRSLTRTAGGSIFLNVHVGGILVSDDEGATWRPTAIDVDADVHQVLADGELVLAATAWGMAASPDSGASWEFDDAGLHASYSRAIAVSRDFLLISASEGPFRGRAAVYRKKLGSNDSFEKCREGLPEWFTGNIDTHSLAADGATVAFASEDGHLFTSEDAGRRWSIVAEGLPEPSSALVIRRT